MGGKPLDVNVSVGDCEASNFFNFENSEIIVSFKRQTNNTLSRITILNPRGIFTKIPIYIKFQHDCSTTAAQFPGWSRAKIPRSLNSAMSSSVGDQFPAAAMITGQPGPSPPSRTPPVSSIDAMTSAVIALRTLSWSASRRSWSALPSMTSRARRCAWPVFNRRSWNDTETAR